MVLADQVDSTLGARNNTFFSLDNGHIAAHRLYRLVVGAPRIQRDFSQADLISDHGYIIWQEASSRKFAASQAEELGLHCTIGSISCFRMSCVSVVLGLPCA